MIQNTTNNIYTIVIPLPGSPLKWLNSYVIKGREDERSLLIDTGYNLDECKNTLLCGMHELGLSAENTDVLLTHRHADHSGNAAALQQMGYRILMAESEHRILHENAWEWRKPWIISEGMPEETYDRIFLNNPGVKYASPPFTAEFIDDGDTLCYGGHTLRCVRTPGHTAGHICLYDEKEEIIFCGDHVLFDITPNICSYGPNTDALGDFITSLKAVKGYPVRLALAAHRNCGRVDFAERADTLIAHHESRLDEAYNIIKTSPGLTAYQTASFMTWRMRSSGWDDFPVGQKWFAVSEALAHLDHLVHTGLIKKSFEHAQNAYIYFI